MAIRMLRGGGPPRGRGRLSAAPAWPGRDPDDMGGSVRLRLKRDPDAAGSARRSLETLRGDVEDEVLEELRLLVTELVTNSVRHSDAARDDVVGLDVDLDDHRVRVEVSDGGSGFEPVARRDGQSEASGWGLHLIDALADRWGVWRGPRTRVWFEMDRPDPARRLRAV